MNKFNNDVEMAGRKSNIKLTRTVTGYTVTQIINSDFDRLFR